MKTMDRYEDLAQLATAHMTKGVRANTMVSEAEYGRAVEAGTLSAQSTPAGLCILRDRGDHHRLNFYLNDLTAPLAADLPSPTVTEVAYRPRDMGLQEAVTYLQAQGFSLLFERIRMSRPAGETDVPAEGVIPAGESDQTAVAVFLQNNFSSLTGCLPNAEELTEDVRAGHILLLKEGADLLGLLHFSWDGKSGEIRHLAVREDRRGQGLTSPLIAAFIKTIGGAKSAVWLRDGFPAAQAAYTKLGFTPDGRRSAVLCNNIGKKD